MVEVLVGLLKAFSESATKSDAEGSFLPDIGSHLSRILADAVTGYPTNAAVFRESGGVSAALHLVKADVCRMEVLQMIQQLIQASGSEEDMTSLLELLHSTPRTNLALKSSVLESLRYCLGDSHKARVVFR